MTKDTQQRKGLPEMHCMACESPDVCDLTGCDRFRKFPIDRYPYSSMPPIRGKPWRSNPETKPYGHPLTLSST